MKEQIKSKKQVVDYGGIFTHKREVKAMLDLVKVQNQFIINILNRLNIMDIL